MPNGVAAKEVRPRISLILASDSLGNLWVSLTQVNTTSKMFTLYIKELVRLLDRERPDWRKNTVMTVDGASYHKTKESFAMFNALNVPLSVLSPSSYNVAACELVFSALKRQQLNPARQPTGKRYVLSLCLIVFSNLVFTL